jgi:hypothetical protein
MGIRYDGGGGASVPVTSYAETFIRADQPFLLGNNWYNTVSQSSSWSGANLAAQVNVGGTGATFGAGGLLFGQCYWIPTLIDVAAVLAQSAIRGVFAQFTITGHAAGVSGLFGLMCFNPNPNDSNGYMLLMRTTTLTAELFRDVGPGQTSLVAPALNWVDNDIIRLEVIPAAAANTCKSYKNGVLQNTFVDNNAARPAQAAGGTFGLCYFSNNTGSLTFKNFSGGVL